MRATALYLLRPVQDATLADAVAPLLRDADPLVRASAAELQQGAAMPDRVARLVPLLSDPRMVVRNTAARQFLNLPPEALRPSQSAMLGQAMAEWRQSLATRFDFPETHLVLGGMALTLRNFPAALGAFREVVTLDPQRADAWMMLVRLTDATEGREAARRVLRQAIERVPGDPGLMSLSGQMTP